MEQERLMIYDVTLRTKAPLFIGSGKSYTKKEYCYQETEGQVAFMDNKTIFKALESDDNIDHYESFILGSNTKLYTFLTECGYNQEEIDKMTRYKAKVGEALVEGKPLAEICEFIHNVKYQPYVPGSSVKGAIRTALLWKFIKKDRSKIELESFFKDKKSIFIESLYLNTLDLKGDGKRTAFNSLMKGISFSDSLPIDRSNMILARKEDYFPSGGKNILNVIRECVKPETDIFIKMTFDRAFRRYFDLSFVKEAIKEFWEDYQDVYVKKFHLPKNTVSEHYENCLILGGGSGYFSKNIVYPILGKEEAVKHVSEILCKKFPDAGHEKDINQGISPRCIKMTTYNNRLYQVGVCEAAICETTQKIKK